MAPNEPTCAARRLTAAVDFIRLAETSRALASTKGRRDKVRLIAEALSEASPDELRLSVALLSGELPDGRVGVGRKMLGATAAVPADVPTLSVEEVGSTLDELRALEGAGSAKGRSERVAALISAATAIEQDFLRALLAGGVRQGAQAGVMQQAIAEAFDVEAALVRRSAMLSGDLAEVAVAARDGGEEGLRAFRLEIFSPLQPMLASTGEDVATALSELGESSVEWKVDGARVQIHRRGDRVAVFTRNSNPVESRLPEVVAAIRELPVEPFVLDAEVVALDRRGRPRPFQETMSRFSTESPAPGLVNDTPLTVFVFDCLRIGDDDLYDLPLRERLERAALVVPAGLQVPRLETSDPHDARRFFDNALSRGHEGVMVKALDSRYAAGRRGAEWRKVKPSHTLDLVVIAVEWGSGRRRGWLSNLHLAAYDPAHDDFVMLGKTFKGLTDEMLEWQTNRFLELEERREGYIVHVRPEQVVEVAFDGVQSSTRYPGGVALRFARVKAYKVDKGPREADTIGSVLELRSS